MISDAYHRLFYDVSYIPAVKVRLLIGLAHQINFRRTAVLIIAVRVKLVLVEQTDLWTNPVQYFVQGFRLFEISDYS